MLTFKLDHRRTPPDRAEAIVECHLFGVTSGVVNDTEF